MSRGDIAKEKFKQGYNCSQSVALAFSDFLGMSEEMIARVTSGFGGGVGRMREVCGAVSGMAFVISALYGYSDPKAFEAKAQLYSRVQQVANEFKNENGSVVCRELLALQADGADVPTPEKRSPEYYKKRPCPELVKFSADILETFISQNPVGNKE